MAAQDITIKIVQGELREKDTKDNLNDKAMVKNNFDWLSSLSNDLIPHINTVFFTEQESGESRNIQLLRRIFKDEDDTSFARRLTNANQLLNTLEESRNTVSDSLQFRQEQMQLLDICIYDEGLRRIVEFGKVPSTLRNTLAKIISGLACYTRFDLALSWIFDRLETWPSSDKSTADMNRDREWKKWLLHLLKQVIK
jgi:hypothetical protein